MVELIYGLLDSIDCIEDIIYDMEDGIHCTIECICGILRYHL